MTHHDKKKQPKTLLFNSRFSAQILLHGVPARNLEHVIEYIEGDAHDRSKVQFLSPEKGFKDFFKFYNTIRHERVCDIRLNQVGLFYQENLCL